MPWIDLQSPLALTIICTLFTWMMTALGAAVVFFFKSIKAGIINIMLGFASGVMVAASFWSLLAPAIEMCEESGGIPWLVPSIGFALGCVFLMATEQLIDIASRQTMGENIKGYRRSILLMIAVTMHNIPEGMVIGVAFGSAALGAPGTTVLSSIILAVGIGLQNFPEGAAVSLPMRQDGISRKKSFFFGQLSGFVEPVAALIGLVAVGVVQSMVPFLLAFSAGAMFTVVIGELIPESALESKWITTSGFILGFVIMMILDVALG